MSEAPTKPETETTMFARLRAYLPRDEWAVARNVPNAAGFDGTRRADAVAMALWPSRGLELNGYEIKVSRSDWRREIDGDAAKAEAVAKYCSRWWIVAPAGIVPVGELPDGWGLLESDGAAGLGRAPSTPSGCSRPAPHVLGCIRKGGRETR